MDEPCLHERIHRYWPGKTTWVSRAIARITNAVGSCGSAHRRGTAGFHTWWCRHRRHILFANTTKKPWTPPRYGTHSWHLFFTGSIPSIALHNSDSLPHILRQPRALFSWRKQTLRRYSLSSRPACQTAWILMLHKSTESHSRNYWWSPRLYHNFPYSVYSQTKCISFFL